MERLFKFVCGNSGEEHIDVFLSEEIQKEYNVYGFFYKNERYQENLDDFKSQGCPEDFEYCCSKDTVHSGPPKEFIMYDDEENVSSLEGFWWDEGEEPLKESDLSENHKYEYYEYHNGSSFEKIYVSGEGEYIPEDVTEQYSDSFQDKKLIGNSRTPHNDGGRWEEFHYSPKTKDLWVLHVSLWQGTRSVWEVIDDPHPTDVIFVLHGGDEDIDRYRPTLREKHGHNLRVLHPRGDEHYNVFDYDALEIFSKDDAEFLSSTSSRGQDNTRGIDYYKLGERVVMLSWSMWQGEKEGWYVYKTYEEFCVEN